MSLRNPVTNLRWLNSDHQKRINAIFFLIVCFLAAFFAKLCNSQESSETTSGVKYNTEFFPEIPDTSRCAVLDGSDSVSLHWEISNNFPFAIKLAGTSTGCSCTSVSVSERTIDPGCKSSIIATISIGKGSERKARSGEIALTFVNANEGSSTDGTGLYTRYVHKRLYECVSVPSVEWPSSIVNSANGMDGMFDVRFFGERDLTRLKFVSSTPGVKLEYFIGESASWVGGTCRSVQVRATFPNSLDTDTTTDISIHLFAATRELGSTAEMLIGSKLIQFRKKYAYALIPKNVFLRKNDNTDIKMMITRKDGFPDVQSCKVFLFRNEFDTEIPVRAFEVDGNLSYVSISIKDVVSEIHEKDTGLRVVVTTLLGDIELRSGIIVVEKPNSNLQSKDQD